MKNCSDISKLLKTSYFEQDNEDLLELGSKALDLLLAKVAKVDLKNPHFYEQFQSSITSLVIKEVKISSENHLRMYLGEMVKNGEYNELRQIQNDLSKIVKQNKKMDKSLQTTKQKSQLLSKSSIDKSIGNSNLQKIQIKKQESSVLEMSGYDFLKGLQEAGQVNSNVEILLKSIQSNSKSLLTKDVDIQKLEPEEYLKSYVKNYNSQLNCLVQKFTKYELRKAPEWQESSDNSKGLSIQSYYVIIPPLLGGNRNGGTKIFGKGQAYNKKNAKTLASLFILRQIYQAYPNIFNKMVEIRKKEAIDN